MGTWSVERCRTPAAVSLPLEGITRGGRPSCVWPSHAVAPPTDCRKVAGPGGWGLRFHQSAPQPMGGCVVRDSDGAPHADEHGEGAKRVGDGTCLFPAASP